MKVENTQNEAQLMKTNVHPWTAGLDTASLRIGSNQFDT